MSETERAREALSEVEAALVIISDEASAMQGHQHWDPSGGSGTGCQKCASNRDSRKIIADACDSVRQSLRAALSATAAPSRYQIMLHLSDDGWFDDRGRKWAAFDVVNRPSLPVAPSEEK